MRYEIQLLPQGAIGRDIGIEVPLAGKGVAPKAPPCPECPEQISCPDPSAFIICPDSPYVTVGDVTMIAVGLTQPQDHDVLITLTLSDVSLAAFYNPVSHAYDTDTATFNIFTGGVGASWPIKALAVSEEVDIALSTSDDALGTASCSISIEDGVDCTPTDDIYISFNVWGQTGVPESLNSGGTYYRDGDGEDVTFDITSSTLPSSSTTGSTVSFVVDFTLKVDLAEVGSGDTITWDFAGSTCDTSFAAVNYPYPGDSGKIAHVSLVYNALNVHAPTYADGDTLVLNAYKNGDALTERRAQFTFTFADNFWGG